MADSKTTQLAQLAATPDVADQLMIVDVSDTSMAASGTNKRLAASYLARSDAGAKLITGDGKELTVPATGTAALLATANVFTTVQTINPTGASNAVSVGMALGGTGEAFSISYNGSLRFNVRQQAATSAFRMYAFDNGSGTGPYIEIERNSNGSTPAPGSLGISEADGGFDTIYPDNSGVWRTLGAQPTSGTFAGGTVIGSQTSHITYKSITGAPVSDLDALRFIIEAADRIKRFTYKDGRYGGEEFSGIILDGDELDRYGMDADDEHPAGKALNEITVIGDLVKAVRYLAERVAALEAQVK